jgi:multisubunit Na+/H+ antiporter MnhG subunit
MSDATSGFFPRKISRDQAKDTGMAMVLICLILSFFLKNDLYIKIALVALIINMIVPTFYKYPAYVWLGLSHLLGAVVSRVLLTLIFFIIVTPVSLIRRLFGFDSLKLRKFKRGSGSVMTARGVTFSGNDLKTPF